MRISFSKRNDVKLNQNFEIRYEIENLILL